MRNREPYNGQFKDLIDTNLKLKVELVNLKRLYREQLVKTASLQIEIDEINKWCHFFEVVEKSERPYFGAGIM